MSQQLKLGAVAGLERLLAGVKCDAVPARLVVRRAQRNGVGIRCPPSHAGLVANVVDGRILGRRGAMTFIAANNTAYRSNAGKVATVTFHAGHRLGA